jgi:hypothetical protein
MDPVSFEQLAYELRSTHAKKIRALVEELTPGCVIASGTWEGHVVTELPKRLDLVSNRVAVAVRHLHGGHTMQPYLPGKSTVEIYQARAARPTGHQVPVVPRCIIPYKPAAGDRIVMQRHRVDSLGSSVTYEFVGNRWQQMAVASDGRTDIYQASSDAVRGFVSTYDTPAPSGFFVYLPAGHRPHLYTDGRPVPARTAEELAEGDVVLVSGGGRLKVEGIARHADGHTLRLHVLTPSRHAARVLAWASRTGDRVEHHDSGLRGYLYATEPRASELLSAADLHIGDTVIAAWGTPYSNVATVDNVWRQPVRAAMHVHATTPDGRHTRTQTGFDNRYFVLRRATDDGSADIRALIESVV